MKTTDLSKYDNSWYSPGNPVKRALWYFMNIIFFLSPLPWPTAVRPFLLTLFGADMGNGIVIKPRVNIKYPWFLKIGDNSWIGEGSWIDNLTYVKIGENVCLSQEVLLLTGNHNYKKASFDLVTAPITIEDGAWVGAKAVICPGVTVGTHSVITAGSVLTGGSEPYMVYQGNPATSVRNRVIE